MADIAKTWLRRHAKAETALAADLQRFFIRQAKDFLSALGDVDDPQADDVARLFDAAAQTDAMLTVAMPHLARGMAAGVIAILTPRRRKKSFDPDALGDELDDFDLPDYARDAIETSLLELSEQAYWRDIQNATQQSIIDLLNDGLAAGDAGSTIAKAIRQALGADAKVRSKAIARTETTMAYNAGHQSAFDALDADGLIDGKTWLAISDDDVRADHLAANEQTVPVKNNFDIGGYKAPYPGHWSLPAEQRVNCRCTVIGAFEDL